MTEQRCLPVPLDWMSIFILIRVATHNQSLRDIGAESLVTTEIGRPRRLNCVVRAKTDVVSTKLCKVFSEGARGDGVRVEQDDGIDVWSVTLAKHSPDPPEAVALQLRYLQTITQ